MNSPTTSTSTSTSIDIDIDDIDLDERQCYHRSQYQASPHFSPSPLRHFERLSASVCSFLGRRLDME
jgi:hypothetical protein